MTGLVRVGYDETVNTVIMLPQRTYANDCIVREVNPPVVFG